MIKWKWACGILAILVASLAFLLVAQHRQVEKAVIKDYVLQHASVEQALQIGIEEYKESQNAEALADDLIIAYGAADGLYGLPNDLKAAPGFVYFSNMEFFYKVQDQFDFYLPIGIREIMDDAKDGVLTEKSYAKLIGYHQLLEEFNQLALSGNIDKKNAKDYEEDFEAFYAANEEKMTELIN
ncbi:hypothetical protein BN1080_01799 [Planococcus massiliensis]|uniref:Uncharacterized protein n=1 Tax=Planococcus massiliensis TaxID=1499687 RepID=A0A098EKG7_9BACL|nr:hypothetical protein [Planococcus massiliensis]CEG22864.1 hypothetical protein BN1080_01799 [Planococcus massiliensis]